MNPTPKRFKTPWTLRGWLTFLVFAVLAACLLMLVGGCNWRTQQVKVPVAVPCLTQAPPLAHLPIQDTSRAEAAALGQTANWAILADRVAASIRLLAADRARLRATLAACVGPPTAAAPATRTASPGP